MSYRQRSRQVTAWVTISAFALTAVPGRAAPPPIPSATPQATPPGRVGRLAKLSGTVSFHTADQDHWEAASLNYPVTSGNSFWTEPQARAAIEVAASRVVMDASTELDIGVLDDRSLTAAEPQGEAYLDVANIPDGGSITIQTPRGVVQVTAAGRYGIAAGDTERPTAVTVLAGSATVTGPGVSLQVGPGQTAQITGADTFQGTVGPLAQDAFVTAILAEEHPVPLRQAAPIPPVVQRMTGSGDLNQYGTWQSNPKYGSVWYPQVDNGYVPYRNGRWSYVAPWGWTWVDQAPWGFAPFHYGRWVQVDDRWGWAPADAGYGAPAVPGYGAPIDPGYAAPLPAEPVYAPALVSFVDVGAAAAVGAAVGFAVGAFASQNVGWVPLGPGEPYFPPYNQNQNYVRNVNVTNVRNVNQVINKTTINNNRTVVNNYMNRNAATVVPASTLVRSTPVNAAVQAVPAQQLAQLRSQASAPVRPTAATPGVTPAVASRLHLAAAEPGQVAPVRSLPGPAIARPLLAPGPARPEGAAGLTLRPAAPGLPSGGQPSAEANGSAAPKPMIAPPNVPNRPFAGQPRPPAAPASPKIEAVRRAPPDHPNAPALQPAAAPQPPVRRARPDVPRPAPLQRQSVASPPHPAPPPRPARPQPPQPQPRPAPRSQPRPVPQPHAAAPAKAAPPHPAAPAGHHPERH
jgi:hypothetical protein